MTDLIARVRKGETQAIARAISWVENDDSRKEQLIDALYPHSGHARILGVTGPPGAGKSTLVDKMITRLRQNNRRVAVVAVDPSSPFSGGAILGDRLRMQQHATDEQVFIRSMASRGHLGGVAGATADAALVFDAAGYDVVIIETIGVGQSEIEIVGLSDLVVLVLVPGMGDEIQALKAGVMEIGDVFVINKKDHDGAQKLRAEIEYVLGFKHLNGHTDRNPVVMTAAVLNEGITELMEAIDTYWQTITQNGRLVSRRRERLIRMVRQITALKIHEKFDRYFSPGDQIDRWIESIQQGHSAPYAWINTQLTVFLKEMRAI